jgi:hypothetical protein
MTLGEVRDRPGLLARQQAVGDANAHHEKFGGLAFAVLTTDDPDAISLRVYPPGTQIRREPFRRNRRVAVPGKVLDCVKMLPGILLALDALDALRLGLCRSFSHLRFHPP